SPATRRPPCAASAGAGGAAHAARPPRLGLRPPRRGTVAEIHAGPAPFRGGPSGPIKVAPVRPGPPAPDAGRRRVLAPRPPMSKQALDRLFPRSDTFAPRHLGPRASDHAAMLETLGVGSMDELIDKALPASIRWRGELALPPARGETEVIEELRELAAKNRSWRAYLGMGYHGTITPPVILRNILENPGWYTQYTPYQAEISQGRLEALLNYQTVVLDLTGLDCANASMLDEATAAAEAMTMFKRVLGRSADGKNRFLVADDCHPQTIAVVRTRAEPLGIDVTVADPRSWTIGADVFGCLVQYPGSSGRIDDLRA